MTRYSASGFQLQPYRRICGTCGFIEKKRYRVSTAFTKSPSFDRIETCDECSDIRRGKAFDHGTLHRAVLIAQTDERLALANGIQCVECGSLTRITPGTWNEQPACPVCEDAGAEDPWCVMPVLVYPCPLEGHDDLRCVNDSHHWGRGDHVMDLA